MADETGGEKSLPASPQKIQRAREQGNVARSQDLSSGLALLVALIALWLLSDSMWHGMIDAARYYFAQLPYILPTRDTMRLFAFEGVWLTARVVLPFMGIMLVTGLTANVLQIGFLFTAKPLQPKFNRLNPITGMRRFFSARIVVELVKSLFKLSVISGIVWYGVRGRLDEVLLTMHLAPVQVAWVIAGLIAAVWWRVVLAMLVLGLLDLMFQRWMHARDLRMTVREAREEAKQLEGDPRIKQRVRAIQRQMAMQRMMAEVPTADVIITNPTTFAVALRYDVRTMNAPTVVAKGARLVAERIRSVAVEHDVPIVEKPELARALFQTVDLNQPVPEALFVAVAEVLAFVYEIDRRADKVRERQQTGLARPALARQAAG
jgi:flagellar biosynthesis protein FlhB